MTDMCDTGGPAVERENRTYSRTHLPLPLPTPRGAAVGKLLPNVVGRVSGFGRRGDWV